MHYRFNAKVFGFIFLGLAALTLSSIIVLQYSRDLANQFSRGPYIVSKSYPEGLGARIDLISTDGQVDPLDQYFDKEDYHQPLHASNNYLWFMKKDGLYQIDSVKGRKATRLVSAQDLLKSGEELVEIFSDTAGENLYLFIVSGGSDTSQGKLVIARFTPKTNKRTTLITSGSVRFPEFASPVAWRSEGSFVIESGYGDAGVASRFYYLVNTKQRTVTLLDDAVIEGSVHGASGSRMSVISAQSGYIVANNLTFGFVSSSETEPFIAKTKDDFKDVQDRGRIILYDDRGVTAKHEIDFSQFITVKTVNPFNGIGTEVTAENPIVAELNTAIVRTIFDGNSLYLESKKSGDENYYNNGKDGYFKADLTGSWQEIDKEQFENILRRYWTAHYDPNRMLNDHEIIDSSDDYSGLVRRNLITNKEELLISGYARPEGILR